MKSLDDMKERMNECHKEHGRLKTEDKVKKCFSTL